MTLPTRQDYLLELYHQRLEHDQPAAVEDWRNQVARALEAWDLPLASRLIAELVRHPASTKRQANLRLGRAALLSKRGEWLEAVAQVEQSIPLFEQLGDLTGQCWALMTSGNLHSNLGQWALAAQTYQQAADLQHRMEDTYGEAQTLVNLGGVYYQQG
jgi:tetratricopeptide (TPR) repeat protein